MNVCIRFLPILFAAALLGGCGTTSISALRSITVSVVDLKPAADGESALLTVRYFNASPLAIGLTEADHRLQVNGANVGRVVNKQPVGLPPSGSSTETITLPLSRGTVLTTGPAAYLLETRILVMAGSEELRERIETRGMVEITRP